jgi:hypothetical protein
MLKDVDAECDRLPRDLYDEEVHAGVDVNAVPSECHSVSMRLHHL